MKIAYFVGEFPYRYHFKEYQYGGSTVAAYQLAINMVRRGHEVKIFTNSKDFKSSIENVSGINVYRYRKLLRCFGYNISLSLLYKPLFDSKTEIIHLHIGGAPNAILGALIYRRLRGKPLVVTYHTEYNVAYSGRLSKKIAVCLVNKMIDAVLSAANIVVTSCDCDKERSELLKKYKEKVIKIPIGITPEVFDVSQPKDYCRSILNLPSDKDIILFLGGLHYLKGPHVLLKSIPYVLKHRKDVIFIFVGAGDIKKYKKIAEKMGVNNYVTFTGYVDDQLKILYFRSADIFVYPLVCYLGGFGIVTLEAMASSLPIVASNICGLNEVIRNGENGLLVPPGDHQALANAILYLLENPDVRRKLGENGKREAQKYTWVKVAEEYEKIYEKLICNQNS